MFGKRHHFGSPFEGKWAARRGWRGHFGPGEGLGRRHGRGGGDMMRAGRMLAQGDLRLIALALIAEQPRHGYEIIKVLEDKTAGWYAPSPGIVYPTLTYLEEAGHVTAQAEGAKKLYTITDTGRAHLGENRDFVDAVLERLAAIGEKAARVRRHFDRDEYRRDDEGERQGIPPLVRAAIENLREAAAKRLADDAEAEAKVVEVLARAATELRKA
jgi:DNA-binding PadR family transcriptional regulator